MAHATNEPEKSAAIRSKLHRAVELHDKTMVNLIVVAKGFGARTSTETEIEAEEIRNAVNEFKILNFKFWLAVFAVIYLAAYGLYAVYSVAKTRSDHFDEPFKSGRSESAA